MWNLEKLKKCEIRSYSSSMKRTIGSGAATLDRVKSRERPPVGLVRCICKDERSKGQENTGNGLFFPASAYWPVWPGQSTVLSTTRVLSCTGPFNWGGAHCAGENVKHPDRTIPTEVSSRKNKQTANRARPATATRNPPEYREVDTGKALREQCWRNQDVLWARIH